MSELGRSGGVDDDPEDGLWREFENCAQAVAHLFRCANWRNLQTAAASTTQLYKSGLDSKKRAFERGFLSGRQALAKEIFSLCRYSTTIDVEEVVTLLSRYALLPEHSSTSSGNASSPHRRQRNLPAANSSTTAGIEGPSAVNLFQQALCLPESPTHRAPELNNFLQNQVYRHRKRAHSPGQQCNNVGCSESSSSSAATLHKRFKRL